jgi:NAD(P)-dependent dehydrogenase (short-subunit alcohol dehydrogenase family)
MGGRLEGKVALVTGGASGIGRACAVRFASEGAAVVVADLDERGGAETVEVVETAEGRARFVRMDVTSEADCEALADAAVSAFGRLDVVVAAAGIDQGRTDGQPAPR